MPPRRTVTVHSSDTADAAGSHHLSAHYCLKCGSLVFLATETASRCPRRRTDGSYVVDDLLLKKTNLQRGAPRDVLQPKGVDRQYPLLCTSCGVDIAYRPKPPGDASNERTYVLPGIVSVNPALSLSQLRVV
eukprot:gene1068-15179_t